MKVESVKTIISEEKGFINFKEAQLNIKETGEWYVELDGIENYLELFGTSLNLRIETTEGWYRARGFIDDDIIRSSEGLETL
ncbi:hypothetical protein [Halalkalibacter flavus]|uniref:hypothetical protein n=1 Tax=Halalkalibacter flavus TaxID=3090668 RepID=UPI002FCBDCA3